MKHGSQQRFSIRKYSFGAASVLIASLTFLGGQAQADSLTENSSSSDASNQVEFQVTTQTASEPVLASSQAEGESTTTANSSSQQEEVLNEKVAPSSGTEVTSEVQNPVSQTGGTYSSTLGQSVGSTYMSRAATAGSPSLASLPDSGTYVFEEPAEVHSQPRLSSSVVATYQKGQSVRYDRIVSEDERLWLSYTGGSGARRYVALPSQNNSGQTTDSAVANTLNALAPQGTYTFSKTAGVKNEARIASPDVATYQKGQTVRYDRVLTADNYRWLSYISYSGARRYVAVEELAQPAKPVAPEVKVEKTGKVSTSNVSIQGYEIQVSNVQHPDGVKEVLVPSWSEKNGQDDIIWHKAIKQTDGSYKARIAIANHKQDTGAYQSHVYYVTNQNKRDYVTETKVIVPQKQAVQKTGQVVTSNVSSSGFDVEVKNVNHPEGVKEVLIPSWSEKNGQDDLIWHKATKQPNGSYKVRIESSQHKNDLGAYQSHVYYVTSQNKRDYVIETRVIVPQKQAVQKTGQVTTSNVSSSGFDVVVKNVNHPEGVKEVLVPSWSEKNGQDDIVWHKAVKQADGTYKVRIESKKHKNEWGTYQVHVHYVTEKNEQTYVTETKVNLPENKDLVRVENITASGFDVRVIVPNANVSVREVLVPTWTTNNGQDDIIWYSAVRQSDGSYKTRIDYSRHNYEFGDYTIHSYFKDTAGKMNWIGSTSFDAPKPANYGKGYPEKWVGNKKYSGTVTHIDYNPVYSDKNRVTIDRIVIHHNAGMSDEGARATWYIRNGNETSAHYQVTPDKIWGGVPENEVAWHAGHYPTNQRSIGIEHLNNSLGPHWTIAEATYRNSAKLIADISIRYNIPLDRNHVVGHEEVSATLCPGGIDIDKLLALAKAERAKLEKTALPNTSAASTPQIPTKVEVPYYSQLDSRWASKRYGNFLFGPTGCVPTTLAMAFSGLSGQTVLPTQVGDYIYNNTSAFNKTVQGTAANGIVKAIEKWGYKHEILKSADAIKNTLLTGNPVLLAVGASVFVNYPNTHELLLTDYKDGKVQVSDPYTKRLSGWHSLNYLWNVRSQDVYDNELGSPAIAVKRV